MHLAQPQQNKKNIVPTVNNWAADEWQFWIIEATEHNKKSAATAFMYAYIKYFKKKSHKNSLQLLPPLGWFQKYHFMHKCWQRAVRCPQNHL